MKQKYPKTFLLFRKVSAIVAMKNPERGNAKMNIGVFNESMGSRKQMNFLKSAQPETLREVKYNHVDEGNSDVGKGTRGIPNTKDYYIGESL